MKFKFVKKVEGEVPTYDGSMIKTGDAVELDGYLAKKVESNPDY